jgi:hypothetical protein
VLRRPEDQEICLFPGLLDNPDVSLLETLGLDRVCPLFSVCSTKESFEICVGIPDPLPIPTRVTWLSLLVCRDVRGQQTKHERRCYLFSLVNQDLRQD